MKSTITKTRAILALAGVLAATTAVLLASASARAHSNAPPAISPNAILTWNTNAVNAVRASSPSKFQVEGLIYMSYVQAAVYDAVS